MSKKDYYEVLGVDKGADKKQIKKAYKRLAMKHHPDRNIDNKAAAEEKFKEIQEAYSVLSNEQKRSSYDQFGHAGVGGGASGGNPFGGGGFEDMFGDIFGGFGGGHHSDPNAPMRGADLEYAINISFKEAVLGSREKIRITKDEVCSPCNGSGAEADSGFVTCKTCGGEGSVVRSAGFMTIKTTCPDCNGFGKEIKKKCHKCHGAGVTGAEKIIEVDIPAGINSNNTIRVTGEGSSGANGGPYGDLYLSVFVEASDIFEREGADIYCEVNTPLETAVLGGAIKVPTIDSTVMLSIPKGTQSGTRLKLSGKGAPTINTSNVGDQYCTIHVEVPVDLNDAQESLFRAFSDTLKKHQSPKSEGFIEKLKSFFS